MPNPLSSVRKAVIEAVPSISEAFSIHEIYGEESRRTVDGRAIYKSTIVAGRPIRLADVLAAIDKKFPEPYQEIRINDGFYRFGNDGDWRKATWNLRDDDLEKQTPECISFLAKLLG